MILQDTKTLVTSLRRTVCPRCGPFSYAPTPAGLLALQRGRSTVLPCFGEVS